MMLRAALGFFTRLPIGSAPLPPTFRGVAVWLPVVGLIIGALVSLALGLAAQLLPASLCGVIGCLLSLIHIFRRRKSRGRLRQRQSRVCPSLLGK